MWRSFFFAVGVYLFAAGLQGLVVERFYVDRNNRVLALASQARDAAGDRVRSTLGQDSQGYQNFNDPHLGGQATNYYGGPSPFQARGFNNQLPINARPAGYSTGAELGGTTSQNSSISPPKDLKMYLIKDWIPWCLLAIGTIVCLYTQSLGHLRHSSE